jgi:aspartate dehydrogenase
MTLEKRRKSHEGALMKKRIGIIGFGVIGSYLFHKVKEEESMQVEFVFDEDHQKTEALDPSLVLPTFDDFEGRNVHLVVEAAVPEAVRELGLRVLKKSDFLILSLTSLADEAFRQEIDKAAKSSGREIYIPHGAILGLDGIHDGKKVLEKVEITTIKSPKSLGLKDEGVTEATVVYEGPTREACKRFPRNVNVHASLALTGLGFDSTRSKIVADPGTKSMMHVIEAIGKGLRWKIEIESRAIGEVTGAYTPESIYQTVRRICLHEGGLRLA